MDKQTLMQQYKELIEASDEKDLHVLELLAEGMNKKLANENGTYIGSLLHAKTIWEDDGSLVIEIPNTPIVQNNLDILHGGITATLLDSAMGTYAASLLPKEKAAVTSEMKINYTAPGIGETLTCRTECIHKGSKTIVMQGQVFRDDGELIAHSTATFFIINRK